MSEKSTPIRRARLSRTQREEIILATARDLFYRRGVHTVGMDEFVALTGLGKATVYRLYPSKERLVTAYLEDLARRIFDEIDGFAASGAGAFATLRHIVDGAWSPIAGKGFRGCPLYNASIEFDQADHPARRVARDYRSGLRARLQTAARAAGAPSLGDELAVLIDGMYANGAHLGPRGPARAGRALAHRLIDAAEVGGR